MNSSFILSPCLYPLRSHPFPLIRLQPIIDLFYLSNPSIRYLLHQKKETVPFVGSLEKTKNKARLIPTSRRLFGLSGKD